MITERFLGEPKLVLLWHHDKKKTHLEKNVRVKLKRTAHKNNFTLLALIDPWRILNIHGTFTFHKGFITVGKCSLDFLNAPHTKKKKKFKNWSLKSYLGNQKLLFCGITECIKCFFLSS